MPLSMCCKSVEAFLDWHLWTAQTVKLILPALSAVDKEHEYQTKKSRGIGRENQLDEISGLYQKTWQTAFHNVYLQGLNRIALAVWRHYEDFSLYEAVITGLFYKGESLLCKEMQYTNYKAAVLIL